ncbi:hypothetical protein CIHG_02573 [Coccidioides immitis H538.4]|uniref:Inositol polyphosphate-related phosphatase domain-containing protein n=1 Tax=Coccidioides immitis H538.4 TaxID=396776 RepID=A0A0J8RLG7_COCIT|nr:hypothetical protein CIHG_02573 [Coccidioides immitis H538.4]
MESLSAYILTFNCARNVVEPEQFASHLFDGLNTSQPESPQADANLPDILILALQEIAPIAYAFLGGSYLDQYYASVRSAVDRATAVKGGAGYDDNGGVHYVNLLSKNVGLTALMVFARNDVSGRIRYVEVAEVGVGVQETGNKGAVGARIGYLAGSEEDSNDDGEDDIVEMTFVSAHLAPGEREWKRRNEDWKSIAQRLVFHPEEAENSSDRTHPQEDEEGVPLLRAPSSLSTPSALYSPKSYLLVAGDFNYRTSDTGPGPDDCRRFPRPRDDPNDFVHFADLFMQDQLTREREAGRVFDELQEAKITFPPTYKYSLEARDAALADPNGNWKWAKNRWPSWCDRILYRNHPSVVTESAGIKVHMYTVLPLFSTSDHRAVVLFISVPLKAHPEPGTYLSPFEVDPHWDTKRAAARRKELAIGAAAYLGLTWEGNGLMLAAFLAVAAAYYGFRTFLAG